MNATRLIFSLALSMGLALAGCGGGSSPSPGDSGVVSPAPDMPGGNNSDSGGDDAPAGGGDTGNDSEDGGDGSTTPPAPSDPNKPEIVSTDPGASDDTVDANATITVVFDDIIDPVSATLASVRLEGPDGEVDIDVSTIGTKLLIDPKARLDGGAAYTATVSGGIRDLLGHAMGSDYSWQFVVNKELAGLCADFYGESFSLIEGKIASPAGWLAKPPRGVPFADPAHGTCMVRASNAQGELGVTWARNNYSRIQPFNADGSLYLVIADGGRWFVHRTADTGMIRELRLSGGNDPEPHWHPSKPDVLYVLEGDGGLTIREYNVMTDESRIVADLRSVESIAGYPGLTSIREIWPTAARAWTRWEGSPSADGRYWGFMVQAGYDPSTGLGMITYDMKTDTITGVYDYDRDGGGVPQPDHISMSPSGNYVVPSWASPKCPGMSQLGTRNNPCGLMAFSRDFSRAVGLTTTSTHSDIGIDANGRDVMVAGDYATGWVTMWDLETGKRTQLWNFWENSGGTAMHLSARNLDKPGWFLVSTYSERNSSHWYARKIFAIEMTANPRILNIAHTHDNYTSSYWTEPHAAVNRDFTRIMFNSNWGSSNSNTDVYMITLPYGVVPEK